MIRVKIEFRRKQFNKYEINKYEKRLTILIRSRPKYELDFENNNDNYYLGY